MAFMYHVASSEHRESIAANGLLASLDSTGFGAVFLADALPKDCSGFDIWVVDVEGLALEKVIDYRDSTFYNIKRMRKNEVGKN